MTSGYIRDGYNAKGYISAIPGMYPSLRFVYRPALIDARSVILAHAAKQSDEGKACFTFASAMAERVVSWDLKDDRGESVSTEAKGFRERILRVHPALFNRIVNIVLGLEASDIDPADTEGEKAAQAKRELDAAIRGQNLLEEEDAKNSEAGSGL